ncbi:MAG TPA: flagellar biosynthesis protein FlgL [Pseudolabrys sp.]|nr:flagellar biosynthesis protein FlgL [Pseudolabrys sp.]
MSTSSIGAQSALAIQQLVAMRNQFNDLQRQLSSGQKSATYAGLGLDRGVTVSLNAQLSALSGYNSTISTVSTRIDLMNTALSRMTDIGSTVRQAMVSANSTSDASGAVTAQTTAQSSLDELLGLLNTDSSGRYLFSGRATDTPAVESMDHILNGDGARAGLKQLISERTQADLGSNGLGRLTVAQPTSTSVSVTEDAGVFGLKLASANSTLTGATVTGPSGSPASLNVDFSGGTPNDGDAVTLRFNLPDGSTENLTLTATTKSPPGANQFTIGATPAATAANFQSALSSSIGTLAGTSLTAASAVAASNDFFAADVNNPPQRVDGPPFDTATGMTAGTAANTVVWYTGESGSDSARGTAVAQIDQSISVSYGARADEDGLRNLVQNIATLAAVTVSPSDPNATGLSLALNQRLSTNLGGTGAQSLTNIAAQLAGAQTSLDAAKTRHQQTGATLQDYLQQISGVSNEDVGAQILALQTRMQASMQTTAMLFQTSLVNYLK